VQRVKVYRLNDEGKWDDKGTGHVSVEYLEVRFSLPCLWGMLENWLVVQSQSYTILAKMNYAKGDEKQHSVTFSLTCMLERATSFSIAAMHSD
jgi:hypothetical protein